MLLTKANNFISSINNYEKRVMHSKSDDIKTMMNDEANQIIKERFKSLKKRYQNNLESMKGSELVFDYVHLLCCKCHKIYPNRGGSYIHSSDWIKNKKSTINPINRKDNKCFLYAGTVVLNHLKIGQNPERMTKIKCFMNKYNWKEINFSSEKNDWKKFEGNNLTIALNVLYVKKEKIYRAYVSKHNSNRGIRVMFLMIPNRVGRHYLAVKNYLHYQKK